MNFDPEIKSLTEQAAAHDDQSERLLAFGLPLCAAEERELADWLRSVAVDLSN